MILVPTRELALQTSQVCRDLGKYLNLEIMVSTGGSSLKDDILRLYNTVHIIIATPGRILDMAQKGVANLQQVPPASLRVREAALSCRPSRRALRTSGGCAAFASETRAPFCAQCAMIALDEADKLLSPEFMGLVEQVIGFMAPERQVRRAPLPSRPASTRREGRDGVAALRAPGGCGPTPSTIELARCLLSRVRPVFCADPPILRHLPDQGEDVQGQDDAQAV
eukprot:3756003-Prymnesium_polylepis.2